MSNSLNSTQFQNLNRVLLGKHLMLILGEDDGPSTLYTKKRMFSSWTKVDSTMNREEVAQVKMKLWASEEESAMYIAKDSEPKLLSFAKDYHKVANALVDEIIDSHDGLTIKGVLNNSSKGINAGDSPFYYNKDLTLEEAEKIEIYVREMLSSTNLAHGYRLSELKGYNRIDVLNSFKLNIARIVDERGAEVANLEAFIDYVKAVQSCLLNVFMYTIPDFELEDVYKRSEKMELIKLTNKWSYVNFDGVEVNENSHYLGAVKFIEEKGYNLEDFVNYCLGPKRARFSTDFDWLAVREKIGLNGNNVMQSETVENNNSDTPNLLLIAFIVLLIIMAIAGR